MMNSMLLIVENESTIFMTKKKKKKEKKLAGVNKPTSDNILAHFSTPRVHLMTETTANT